jgi:hypothetical protein
MIRRVFPTCVAMPLLALSGHSENRGWTPVFRGRSGHRLGRRESPPRLGHLRERDIARRCARGPGITAKYSSTFAVPRMDLHLTEFQ